MPLLPASLRGRAPGPARRLWVYILPGVWDDSTVPVLISETTRPAPVPAPRRGALARAGAACAVAAAVVSDAPPRPRRSCPGSAQVRTCRRAPRRRQPRARALSTAAVACASCQTGAGLAGRRVLHQAHGTGRTVGSVGRAAPEGAEEPAPVSDAPRGRRGLVAWLASPPSATLAAAADPTTTGYRATRTLAAIALGATAAPSPWPPSTDLGDHRGRAGGVGQPAAQRTQRGGGADLGRPGLPHL